MRHAAAALGDRGVARPQVRLSMERNMKCGVGLCGHCQLRELFICVDGPVLAYDVLEPLMAQSGAVTMSTGRHREPRRPSWRSGSSPPATAASSPCSTARTS